VLWLDALQPDHLLLLLWHLQPFLGLSSRDHSGTRAHVLLHVDDALRPSELLLIHRRLRVTSETNSRGGGHDRASDWRG
jgi:hypothetical protein